MWSFCYRQKLESLTLSLSQKQRHKVEFKRNSLHNGPSLSALSSPSQIVSFHYTSLFFFSMKHNRRIGMQIVGTAFDFMPNQKKNTKYERKKKHKHKQKHETTKPQDRHHQCDRPFGSISQS